MNVTKTDTSHYQEVWSYIKESHIYHRMHSETFISLTFNNDCIAIMDKNENNILKESELILKMHWNKSDGLWDMRISKPFSHRAHAIITRGNRNTDLIQYLHGCCFRPTEISFLKAIKNGNFLTWQGLNNQTLLKHIPPSITTALRNLNKDRKNL